MIRNKRNYTTANHNHNLLCSDTLFTVEEPSLCVVVLTTIPFSQNTTIHSIMYSCYMFRLQVTIIRQTFQDPIL